MASRKSIAHTRKGPAEQVFTLGVQGRKTGVVLRDTGERDENGLQPFTDIFNSPAKGSSDAESEEEDEDSEDSEVDMDIAETPGPDPHAMLLTNSQSLRRPAAKARSPAVTNLQSPPVRAGNASPLRRQPPTAAAATNGAKATARRLNFDARDHGLPKPSGSRPVENGAVSEEDVEEEEAEEEDEEEEYEEEEEEQEEEGEHELSQEEINDFVEESMQLLGVSEDDEADAEEPEPEVEEEFEEEDEDESEPELEPQPPKRKAAAKPAAKPAPAPAPAPKTRGRPPKSAPEEVVAEDDEVDEVVPSAAKRRGYPPRSAKANESPNTTMSSTGSTSKRRRGARTSNADSILEEPEPEPEPAPKRQRTNGAAAAAPAPKAKTGYKHAAAKSPVPASAAQPRGRPGRPPKRKSPEPEPADGDASVLIAPRAPLPKRAGLVINRRDIPGQSDAIIRTRSGRSSYKPLSFWRNEHIELDHSAVVEDKVAKSRLLLPTIKEIVRVEESPSPPRKHASRRGRPAGGRRRKRQANDSDDDEEEELADWERDPGELVVPVAVWEPEHEVSPPGMGDEVAQMEDRVAVSGPAIRTREILGAGFRFTKTLNMPFFGSGVVDLPPGSEKKPKNSRRMHMSFVVHTGRVTVMVNETTFSIGKGGTWFVPRGNYYSIMNEGTKPARIFFCQACEVVAPSLEEEE